MLLRTMNQSWYNFKHGGYERPYLRVKNKQSPEDGEQTRFYLGEALQAVREASTKALR